MISGPGVDGVEALNEEPTAAEIAEACKGILVKGDNEEVAEVPTTSDEDDG